MPSDLVQVGRLWIKDGQKGKFMSGEIEVKLLQDNGADDPRAKGLMIFKNENKEKPNQPDYRIVQAQEKREPVPIETVTGTNLADDQDDYDSDLPF